MSNSTVISWIFMAIAIASRTSPSNYRAISEIADGINHAIPTQKELQFSIKWLIQQNLIAKTSKKYSLTNKGVELYEKSSLKNKTALGIWKNLESEIIKYE